MFGKKKKKEPKVEQVFKSEDGSSENDEKAGETSDQNTEKEASLEEILGVEETPAEPENQLSPKEQEKLDKLNAVKSKISRILQSSNIEIIDENEGDDYDNLSDADNKRKQQEDYDSLKSLFGGDSKAKKQELTLTIDDFDYSYTGQYVDEYDLVHLKNIKKVKLPMKHKKLIKRLSIIGSVVVVVAVAIIVAVFTLRETPVYLKSISLSKTEQTYYLNETFDETGLYIYAEYSDGTVDKIPLLTSYCYDTQGYVDSSLTFTDGTDAILYFSYMGLTTSLNINIVEKQVSEIQAFCSTGLKNLTNGEYLSSADLLVFVKYTNYISELLDFSDFTVRIGTNSGTETLVYSSENGGFLLTENVSNLNYILVSYSYTYNGSSRTATATILIEDL